MAARVLHIMNRVPWPVRDGGTLACYNLLKGLHEAGCEVTLAAMNTSKHYVDMDTLPETFTKLARIHTAYVDNTVKPLPALLNLFGSRSYHISRFITPGFGELLARILDASGFDYVIFDNLFTAPYIDLVRSKTKGVTLLRQHNVEHKIWETLAARTRNPLKKWYIGLLAERLSRFEKESLNKFDGIITLTEDDQKDFIAMGCTRPIYVSPVGVEPVNNVGRTRPLPRSVFHLGAMDWQPNRQAMHWFIREVWPLVIRRYPDAVFVMAGKKMPEEFFRYRSRNIKVLGEVESAPAFMQQHQVMVVPLLAGSGIRVKILEGLALGKAIVTTSLGARGIAVTNGKNILVADTPDEFCQCIGQLFDNSLLCTSLGAGARKLVENEYSNRVVTAGLLGFCRSLAAQ